MKFELSEEQGLLRNAFRDFLVAEYPAETMRRLAEHDPRGYDLVAWRRMAEMGYVGLTVPASMGGQGLGAVELAIACEELGRVCAPGPYLDVALAAHLLATGSGQETLLADVCEGKRVVTIARADSAFAGSPAPPAHFRGGRVQGRKYFVPFAGDAHALLVATAEGVCLAERPFLLTPLPTFDLTQRFDEVTLDHDATLVGSPGVLDGVDRLAAVGAGAMLLGVMSRALETTLAYVQTREAFRRPIGAFQALQHRLADMLLRTESTRSAVYRAAWCLANDDPAAPLACAAAKAYAGDAARLVCGEAIQMHGGIGFTWELDLHFYFKRAKTLEQHYGSTEAQLAVALAAAGF